MAPSIRTILVPIDFSPGSVCAFRFALQLADHSSASIRLLHVVEHGTPYSMGRTGRSPHYPVDDPYVQKRIEIAASKLTALTHSHANPAVDMQQMVLLGHPAKLILQTIRENRMDLVIIGASQANWVKRLLVGTTAEKVTRNAGCPVITLKGAVEMGGLRQILFTLDPEVNQTRVVAELKKLQALLQARIHLILANASNPFPSNREGHDRLREFAQMHQLENYDPYVHAELHRDEGLFGFAGEVNADILAFATHHQHRLWRVFPARSTQNRIHKAPKPVWTFNPAIAAIRSVAGADDYNCVL